jgi:hypothetical protein
MGYSPSFFANEVATDTALLDAGLVPYQSPHSRIAAR